MTNEQETCCLVCFHHYKTDISQPLPCPKCGMEAWRHSCVPWTPVNVMSYPESYWHQDTLPSIIAIRAAQGWTWLFAWGQVGNGAPDMVFCRGEFRNILSEVIEEVENAAIPLLNTPTEIIMSESEGRQWRIETFALERGWRWFLHRDGCAFAVGPPCTCQSKSNHEAENFLRVLGENAGKIGWRISPCSFSLLTTQEQITWLPNLTH